MQRRDFLKASALSLPGFALLSCGGGMTSDNMKASLNTGFFTRPFAVPAELAGTIINGRKTFDLIVQAGQQQFTGQGITTTKGYNGSFLGPTLRVKQNDNVDVNVTNTLTEPTTVHWHGMRVPSNMDGSDHQEIAANQTWQASFTVNQGAASNWYHPHAQHYTASQVYQGLAGLLIVDDANTIALDLPKTYGIDDIPVVVQDRDMNADGTFTYNPDHQAQMNGLKGNTHLVNGVIDAVIDLPAKEIRLRLLNASNARIYQLAFSNGLSFKQIAVDQSLLTQPISMSSITLSPGERSEIIIDLSAAIGDKVHLQDLNSGISLFQMNVVSNTVAVTSTPNTLISLPMLNANQAVRTRPFVLSMNMGSFYINGASMNMNVINEALTFNDIEIWDIQNTSNMTHNFHVHGAYFTIISRNGGAPLAYEGGYKDTVYLPANARVQVLIQFKDYTANAANPFMYHCHILEHEDAGMMGQLTVT